MPAPERIYRTEAIVLRRQNLGEADRILTLFTRDYGKIRMVAKGVRKPTSRKVGHVEPFTRVDILAARGQTLDVLNQIETIDSFLPLRDDLVRATYAGHFIELIDAFTEDADASPPLYDLLANGLAWLSRTSDLSRTARYYELRLLELAGYRPRLFNCVICGEPLQPEEQFFSRSEGGVVCPRCAPRTPRIHPLSLRALKLLRYLQTRPFEVVEELRITPATQKECEHLLLETLTFHLERRLKSAAFLDRLRRERRAARPDTPSEHSPDSDPADS